MWPNPPEAADLVLFTEEILNGKRHVLYSVILYKYVVPSFCLFALSLHWNTEPHMEIVKHWFPQSNSFQTMWPYYNTEFTEFFYLGLVLLHITYYKLSTFINFCYLISTLIFFLHYRMNMLRQMKKYSCRIDGSIAL